MLELLVEKCLLCCEGGIGSLSPGNALRRVFECISTGILLSGNVPVSRLTFSKTSHLGKIFASAPISN